MYGWYSGKGIVHSFPYHVEVDTVRYTIMTDKSHIQASVSVNVAAQFHVWPSSLVMQHSLFNSHTGDFSDTEELSEPPYSRS